ncbi:hypothetical protein AHMF7605_24295 [Adhaeribacter arboris]|uniref:Uncharacterized protein n=1 Tax=Adhaeribacter arboris TaxID=2072846 RepID=A0A2T2YLP7_9BACT|nr:hypothetical protein [Adhaeribacter arboris]PSR56395.1 hypothetical protein AHMF7605_24295 [Adhaeribacter arboris]
MRVIIDSIRRIKPPEDKREFFGQLYDNSGHLLKSRELISTFTHKNGWWQWQVHLSNLDHEGNKEGSCLTYQEAWAHMKDYLDQG